MKYVFLLILPGIFLLTSCDPPPPEWPENHVSFKMNGIPYYSNWDDSIFYHQYSYQNSPASLSIYFYNNLGPHHFGILIQENTTGCYSLDTVTTTVGSSHVPWYNIQYIPDGNINNIYNVIRNPNPAYNCDIDSTSFIKILDIGPSRIYMNFSFDLTNFPSTDTIRIREGEYFLDE